MKWLPCGDQIQGAVGKTQSKGEARDVTIKLRRPQNVLRCFFTDLCKETKDLQIVKVFSDSSFGKSEVEKGKKRFMGVAFA